MKRKIMKIVIVVLSVSVIYCCYFYLHYRIKGEIEVTINGKSCSIYDLDCMFESSVQREEKINFREKDDATYFKNKGIGYGRYIYSFWVREDNLEINPQFIYFKTNGWASEKLYLRLEISGTEGNWEANMILKDKNGYIVEKQIDFTQIDDIKIQMGP